MPREMNEFNNANGDNPESPIDHAIKKDTKLIGEQALENDIVEVEEQGRYFDESP
ncbi:hypothetical protein [Paenibacillus sp. HJGM_3]|uniref:hypothetical protein n=1 Tax=Paenibacillus sp. HJGM_3 TaxID=3379816 RepID=UPI00385CCF04